MVGPNASLTISFPTFPLQLRGVGIGLSPLAISFPNTSLLGNMKLYLSCLPYQFHCLLFNTIYFRCMLGLVSSVYSEVPVGIFEWEGKDQNRHVIFEHNSKQRSNKFPRTQNFIYYLALSVYINHFHRLDLVSEIALQRHKSALKESPVLNIGQGQPRLLESSQ